MKSEARINADGAALTLLGWTQKHWSQADGTWSGVPPGETRRRDCSPSTDPALVVPLAEALRARGYSVCLFAIRGQWEVTVCDQETWERAMVDAPTACEALALAAARAIAEG